MVKILLDNIPIIIGIIQIILMIVQIIQAAVNSNNKKGGKKEKIQKVDLRPSSIRPEILFENIEFIGPKPGGTTDERDDNIFSNIKFI